MFTAKVYIFADFTKLFADLFEKIMKIGEKE